MTTERRHPHVVNLSEIEIGEHRAGDKIAYRARRLTTAVDAKGIGCSWFEIAPGQRAFPHHWHAANEESIYVLDGEGTLRLGGDEVAVRAGDYVALRTGPDHAHQLINTGAAPLRYLCFSTMVTPEVVGYPDSGKIGAMARGGDGAMWMRQLHKESTQVDYYDGEDV